MYSWSQVSLKWFSSSKVSWLSTCRQKLCTHVNIIVEQIGKHWFYQFGLAQSAGVIGNSICYTMLVRLASVNILAFRHILLLNKSERSSKSLKIWYPCILGIMCASEYTQSESFLCWWSVNIISRPHLVLNITCLPRVTSKALYQHGYLCDHLAMF